MRGSAARGHPGDPAGLAEGQDGARVLRTFRLRRQSAHRADRRREPLRHPVQRKPAARGHREAEDADREGADLYGGQPDRDPECGHQPEGKPEIMRNS